MWRLLVSSSSQEGLCLPHSTGSALLLCGPVTLSVPGVSPVTLYPLHHPCLQLIPTQRGDRAEQQRLDWCFGSCGLRSISEVDAVSGFCKPFPLPGSQSQRDHGFIYQKLDKFIFLQSIFRAHPHFQWMLLGVTQSNNSSSNKFGNCWVKQS